MEPPPTLLASLRQLSVAGGTISHRTFQRFLESEWPEMPLIEWREVAKFASDQSARWQAQLLFSPAISPDSHAEEEFTGWERVYQACVEPLIEHHPDLRAVITREHELVALRYVLERRLKDQERQPVRRFLSMLLSNV